METGNQIADDLKITVLVKNMQGPLRPFLLMSLQTNDKWQDFDAQIRNFYANAFVDQDTSQIGALGKGRGRGRGKGKGKGRGKGKGAGKGKEEKERTRTARTTSTKEKEKERKEARA